MSLLSTFYWAGSQWRDSAQSRTPVCSQVRPYPRPAPWRLSSVLLRESPESPDSSTRWDRCMTILSNQRRPQTVCRSQVEAASSTECKRKSYLPEGEGANMPSSHFWVVLMSVLKPDKFLEWAASYVEDFSGILLDSGSDLSCSLKRVSDSSERNAAL